MEIKNTEVYGFMASVRAMRMPMNSHHKQDSFRLQERDFNAELLSEIDDQGNWTPEHFVLGDNDKDLSQRLSKAGTEHRKHLRQITVWADWSLPKFMWSEADTYKHIEKVSESTMHTLMKKEITKDMFESDDAFIDLAVFNLNLVREEYLKTKDFKLHRTAKEILPDSFIQTRSICTNYEALLSIYNQRKNHRLKEWHTICNWILNLPYFKELTGIQP